jgi:hypothetical protein
MKTQMILFLKQRTDLPTPHDECMTFKTASMHLTLFRASTSVNIGRTKRLTWPNIAGNYQYSTIKYYHSDNLVLFIQEAVWFLSNITAGNRVQVQVRTFGSDMSSDQSLTNVETHY